MSNPGIGGIENMISNLVPLFKDTDIDMQVVNMSTESKSYELWEAILIDYMHPVYGSLTIPNVILDPFLGSGTTAELCEAHGINWLGFETKKDYEIDIEKRIARGKERRKKMARESMF